LPSRPAPADEALRWYDQVAAGEHVVSAKVRAAQILLRQNKLDEARERLARRGRTPRVRYACWWRKPSCCAMRGATRKPMPSSPQALEVQPDQPDILYETALAAEKLGHVEVLERHLRRLILKPDSAQAYNALGYSFADRNMRLEEAAQLIDKALSLAPDDPFILDSKGWLLFRQGKSVAALETCKRRMHKSRMPRSPPISAKCCGRLAGPRRPCPSGARRARRIRPTRRWPRPSSDSCPDACVSGLACLAALLLAACAEGYPSLRYRGEALGPPVQRFVRRRPDFAAPG
jgi:tetratricopeptide (TPR) repeat protein